MVVENAADHNFMLSQGYTRMGDYKGSGFETGSKAYYYSTVGGHSVFSQGIMQTVENTYNGVDLVNGRNLTGITGGKLSKGETNVIKDKLKNGQNQLAGEPLMPIYGTDYQVIGFERFSINTKYNSNSRVNSTVRGRVRCSINNNVDFISKSIFTVVMYVITFANPKGGSGKTTAAMLLAEQIALSGGRVAILDLDPNANILAWAQSRLTQGANVPFSVHARPQAEETVELIDQLATETDYLIIDLEGSKDQIGTYALSRTHLCVIPLDGSPMEARQAAQAVRLVQTTANMIRVKINFALLFTRTNAAFQSTDERDVRQEMEVNNIPTLPVRLAKRAPYTRIFRESVLLAELPSIVVQEMIGKPASATEKAMKQVTGAIDNAQNYAQAVINTLTQGKGS